MPLDRLIPAILSATSQLRRSSQSSPFHSADSHALHAIINALLLTPRLITEKYHKRISALIDEEDSGEGDPDAELMWYVLRYERTRLEDENVAEEEQAVAEERLKKRWLLRMEQRE